MRSLGVIPGLQTWYQFTAYFNYGGASERDLRWFSSGDRVLTFAPNSTSTMPWGNVSLGLVCSATSKSHFINPTACYAIDYASSLQYCAPDVSPANTYATYLCRYSRAVKVQQSRVHCSPTIAILRMEEHVLPIVIDICSSRRHQTISIASPEQRLLRTSVRTRHRSCSGVVDVVVLVSVAIGREEQVPSAFAVEEIGSFDDAFV